LSPSESGATYATWNPADTDSGINLSNGDLLAYRDGTYYTAATRSTIGKSSGKWYWEVSFFYDPGDYCDLGVGRSTANLDSLVGSNLYGWSYRNWDGHKAHSDSDSAYGSTYTTDVVIGVALDMDNGRIYFSRNGTWQNSGDPAAGTGYAYDGLSGTLYAMLAMYTDGSMMLANFGATAFSYSAPSGFNSGLY